MFRCSSEHKARRELADGVLEAIRQAFRYLTLQGVATGSKETRGTVTMRSFQLPIEDVHRPCGARVTPSWRALCQANVRAEPADVRPRCGVRAEVPRQPRQRAKSPRGAPGCNSHDVCGSIRGAAGIAQTITNAGSKSVPGLSLRHPVDDIARLAQPEDARKCGTWRRIPGRVPLLGNSGARPCLASSLRQCAPEPTLQPRAAISQAHSALRLRPPPALSAGT